MQVDIGEKRVISTVCSLKILGFPENSKFYDAGSLILCHLEAWPNKKSSHTHRLLVLDLKQRTGHGAHPGSYPINLGPQICWFGCLPWVGRSSK